MGSPDGMFGHLPPARQQRIVALLQLDVNAFSQSVTQGQHDLLPVIVANHRENEQNSDHNHLQV